METQNFNVLPSEKQDQVEEVQVPTVILLNYWKLKKQEVKILVSRKQKSEKQMSKAKADDLKSMLKLMPSIDQQYYRTLGI